MVLPLVRPVHSHMRNLQLRIDVAEAVVHEVVTLSMFGALTDHD